ncbi:hypothetical protein [Myxosarcina sp. GI1]|uniref:hypothetical protein n=1 Tax=Myxosarcina sp. GI1 TaxID=1541065 RepID=UPI00068AD012|nr:hypothetical protein [Myxosarcina sp. GI1]
MNKTISFLILIGVGVLFRSKINNKEQLNTIKTLILTLALPAVIFSALLKIHLTASLFLPPLIVFVFNILMFLSVRFLLPVFIDKKLDLANRRTLMFMLPSLAPYLSCFPFLAEFSEQSSLGLAAIADTGNKIFILVFLYFLAMYWTYGKQSAIKQPKSSQKFAEVLLQPINLTIIVALVASIFGFNLENIPVYFQDSLSYLRDLLTPTILIFIGLAVKVKGKELKLLLGLLIWRSAVAFLISALLISSFDFDSLATMLLIVAFPQSSCSFLPYAQISVFSDSQDNSNKVFNQSLALSLLAISLPYSSFTIVTIYSLGDFFASPIHLIIFSLIGFLSAGMLLRQKNKSGQKISVAHQP